LVYGYCFFMKIVDPYSAATLREILNLNIDPRLILKRGDVLLYKGITIGRHAVMIDGMVFDEKVRIKDVGEVKDIIRAAWNVAERIFQQQPSESN